MICRKKDFDEAYLAECVWMISENAYPYGSPWTKMQFLADIQQPHSDYLLLVEDNQICGFIGYSKVIDEVEITNIAVAVSEQGKGHARHLLQLLITEQIKDSLHVFLEVRLSNEAARKLYESEKFRILGKRKSYYRNPTEDAIIMSRKLKTETMK
ncbi:ribosomal protein S18-alanine N-acetyltransferase [Enterococcus faecium]|nr:ribosomal protein S18-alanine N-acetyltransferase [Enterococcus faecium]